MGTPIVADGFELQPELRDRLIVFIEDYCKQMTLSQTGAWYDEAFHEDALLLP